MLGSLTNPVNLLIQLHSLILYHAETLVFNNKHNGQSNIVRLYHGICQKNKLFYHTLVEGGFKLFRSSFFLVVREENRVDFIRLTLKFS